jgi:hypothetical protein
MLSMNQYGNTCPMCCGDLDDLAYLRTGAAVCLFCGCNAGASASTPSAGRRPDATAFGVSAIAMRDLAVAQAPSGWISPPHDIQIQTGASITLAESTTH